MLIIYIAAGAFVIGGAMIMVNRFFAERSNRN